MYVNGVGTAVPTQCFEQEECWRGLEKAKRYTSLAPRSQRILRTILSGDSGIERRHLALKGLAEAFELTADSLHARFEREAPGLATEAARDALEEAGEPASSIQALLVSTCTGYLCPGLTSYVSERLGLPGEILALDLVGQGCGAALPNLRTAEALLRSGRFERVLSVCVEVCSAAFYLDDDPGVLVSACLFGDGAGAVVLGGTPGRGRSLLWKSSSSLLEPAARPLLRFEQKGGMLRNVLSPRVPVLAALRAQQVLDCALVQAQLKRSHITGWLFHPGGRDVLRALESQLQLEQTDLRWSWAVLREYGNLSSASLFFVLKEALREPAPAGWWWLSAFGAGFSCHGAILEVQ